MAIILKKRLIMVLPTSKKEKIVYALEILIKGRE